MEGINIKIIATIATLLPKVTIETGREWSLSDWGLIFGIRQHMASTKMEGMRTRFLGKMGVFP